MVWNWFWINNLTGIESQLKNTKTHVSLYSLHQWMFLVSLRGQFPVFLKYVARCFIFVHVVEHEITGWERECYMSNHLCDGLLSGWSWTGSWSPTEYSTLVMITPTDDLRQYRWSVWCREISQILAEIYNVWYLWQDLGQGSVWHHAAAQLSLQPDADTT